MHEIVPLLATDVVLMAVQLAPVAAAVFRQTLFDPA
jgi:hypothetical protein